jgi:hypothetical protein
LDVLALRESLGERLIYLLGNHELPHLYGVTLAKGEHVYTPRFEAALGKHRPAVISLFDTLPFYARTRSGVAICHAGAAAELSVPGAAVRLFTYSHQRVREEVEALLPEGQRPAMRERLGQLNGVRYDVLARDLLAVSAPDDGRYDDLLLGYVAQSHPDFELLWEALVNRNERQYGLGDYTIFLDALLMELSAGYRKQEVLVAGHVPCRGGYTVVAERQLRLASGAHADPHQAGHYLLFDVAKPVRDVEILLDRLHSVLE